MPNPPRSPSAIARGVAGLPEVDAPVSVRTVARRTLDRLGGPVGLVAATAPTVVFVGVDAAAGLATACAALGVSAVALCALRLLRRESPLAALAGLLVAGACAGIAALVGESRAFFLPTTVLPALFVLAYTASMLARRPLTELLVHPVSGGPRDWRRDARLAPALRRTYWLSSVVGLALSAANLLTRTTFYLADEPAVLGVVQVVSTPVFAAHLVLTLVFARRAAASVPA